MTTDVGVGLTLGPESSHALFIQENDQWTDEMKFPGLAVGLTNFEPQSRPWEETCSEIGKSPSYCQ